MAYNELYAKSFKYGMMFGKDIKPGEDVSVSVTKVDDIVLAVKKAYIDMSPRTFKNNVSDGGESLNPQKKEALFESLAEKISDYMNRGTDNFDDWHYNLCIFF